MFLALICEKVFTRAASSRPTLFRMRRRNSADYDDLCPTVYTIQPGQTNAASLSAKFDLSAIYFLNPKKNLQQLQAGDTILVPGDDCESKQEVKLYYPDDDAFEDTNFAKGHTLIFCVAFILGENYRTADSIRLLKVDLMRQGAIEQAGMYRQNQYIEVPSSFHYVVNKLYQQTKNQNTFYIVKDSDLNYHVKDITGTVIYSPTRENSVSSYTEYQFAPLPE